MGPAKTIGIELWAGQSRGDVKNVATCYRQGARGSAKSMRQLFVGAYSKFASLCREADEPGLALLAVDEVTGVPAGLVRLRARFGRHVAAIVGRHDQCDLYLSGHSSMALRHLAIVLDPVQSWRRNSTSVHYRVLDLRTGDGFTDEHGKPMRGLRAEGPAFVRCAGHALFVLPIGDPTDWPESPSDAWDVLPERVYFDEMRCSPNGSLTNMPVDVSRKSMIFRTHGPRDTGTGESLIDRGDASGTLELLGSSRNGRMTIGDRALRDGVLLGRYARCDGAEMLEDLSMSRVHMLLLQVDDALLAIDTCSRNGSHLPGETYARVIAVADNTQIHLGKHTLIRWHWNG